MRPPIEHSCYWLAQNRPEPDPPLRGRAEGDIVVVGAGLTGLWTAIRLLELEPRSSVVVLESQVAAHGASGRNAGMVSEGIDHSYDLSIAHFGFAEAKRLGLLGQENLAQMLGFLAEHGIGCDLERTGTLHVALQPSQLEDLQADIECARRLGIDHLRLLSREETRAEVRSPRYEGALFNSLGAILDPVKLVRGLKREALRRGALVHEQTPVTGLEAHGAAVRVRTEKGEVVARRAVLATSAYSHQLLPNLRFRFMPLYDYVLASEPLSAAQSEAIGWKNRQGVTDVRSFFKYYRLTADNRVVWGTSEALYYRDNRVDASCDHSERHYRELADSFARHFPALADLKFPFAWGGPICATTRFTPFFGSALGGRVFYGLGYTGHGLATTHLAGRILSHLALARPSPLLDLALVRRKPFPYPPEPLRRWAVGAVTRALRRVDRGERPSALLRLLDALGIGLSS